MPGESTQVLNKIKTFQPYTPRGRKTIWETTGSNPNPLSGGFAGVTGSTKGSDIVSDILYNQSAALVLESAGACPSGCCAYLESLNLSVNGATAWAASAGNLPGLAIQDSLANPLVFIPVTALASAAQFAFPINQSVFTNQLAVASYSGQVITFAASTFSGANSVRGFPGYVISGTGAGQTFMVASNTTAAITITNPAFPVALDATSVVALGYFNATAATGTTLTDSKAAFPTSASATGLTAYWVYIVYGTGAGQALPIVSNTSTVITTGTWSVTPDTTSVFMVTTNPVSAGAFDMAVSTQNPAATTNQGVQAAIVGTMSAGSPIRCQWRGYWAYQ